MMMVNEYFDGGVAVTASNTVNDPAGPFGALYTGSGGNITIVDIRGRTLLLAATQAGTILRVSFKRVNVTGTAATSIVGLYTASYKGPSIAQT